MFDFINVFRYRKGISLIRDGKIHEAIGYYQQKIAENPSSAFLHMETARAFFKIGDIDSVRKYLYNAVSYDDSPGMIRNILELTNRKMICSTHYYNHMPAFSPCGTYIVFPSARVKTSGSGNLSVSDRPGLYRYNLKTAEEECLVSSEYYNSSPCFSPDSTKLLFLSARMDTDGNKIIDNRDSRALYVLNFSTGIEELLVKNEHKIKHASFSSDGKKIIYYCFPQGASSGNVYLLNLETMQQLNLTPDDYESTFPSISPDGSRYVFSSWRRDTNRDGQVTLADNSGIYCRGFDAFNETTIAPDTYDNSFPSFSPDSRYVVFLSRRRDTNRDGIINSQDNSGIYRFDLKKNKEKILVTDDHYNKYAVITPDGKTLVFLSSWRRRKGLTDLSRDYFEQKGIYAMDLISWKISQVVNNKYYSSHAPVISPDSRIIAYTSWRKNTSRGLYLARIHDLPEKNEIISYIKDNLSI